jgi:hypothetical protein
MFGATSFANAIKPKSFDCSNFKRWRELATLWLTTMNVMYVTTEKALEGVSEEKKSMMMIICSGVPSSAFWLITWWIPIFRGRRRRIFGRLLRLSTELLTLAESYT